MLPDFALAGNEWRGRRGEGPDTDNLIRISYPVGKSLSVPKIFEEKNSLFCC